MDVIKAPDTRLKVKTKPVKKITPGLLETTRQMIKLTKTFKDPEGVGLAATQIGQSERFFVAKDGTDFLTVINPEVLSTGAETKKYFEGCLSIPNFYGDVRRPLSIKVKYQDETGKVTIKQLKGVAAWIFQHEIDHLNGFLFPERVLEQGGRFYRSLGKDKVGEDLFEEVTI